MAEDQEDAISKGARVGALCGFALGILTGLVSQGTTDDKLLFAVIAGGVCAAIGGLLGSIAGNAFWHFEDMTVGGWIGFAGLGLIVFLVIVAFMK